MEKYSRWRDAGTGIQPFLPPVPPRTESSLLLTLSNVIHYIVGPIQGLVKGILIVALALLYVVFVTVIGTLLAPLGPVRRIWTRCFSALLLRAVLLFLGFFHIKTETVSLRRGTSRTNKKAPVLTPIRSGDVMVANSTSYIDLLYLAYRHDPIFTRVHGKKLRTVSLWQAIRTCAEVPAPPGQDEKLYTVKELARVAKERRWGPVVVLPEGTTSNGRALLEFAPLFGEYQPSDRDARFHLVAFKYEYKHMPPSFTVGSQLWHFARLCSQFYNTLLVKRLASDDVPCSAMMSSGQQASDLAALSGKGTEDVVGSQLALCLGNMSRLRKTSLNMSDKHEFLKYYRSRKS